MTISRNHWYSVKGQSLAIYARDAGFDLAMYDEYTEPVQAELRRRAVRAAMYAIQTACEENGFDIASVKRGVYVISLAHPLSVQYMRGRSQVIYIGLGNILNRIKAHFDNTLFDFMLSLSGADFDFNFAYPALRRANTYYKHVEHLMLDHFYEKFGGTDKIRKYPILNTNAGANQNFVGGTDWWKTPLKAAGKRPLWELKPTKFGDFPPLDRNY